MNTMTDVQDLFRRALQRHQAGHLKDAEQLYNKILRRRPNHEEAIHLLGLIRFQQSDYPKAITLITRAIEIDHGFAAAHYNLGRCFEQIAENEKAIQSYNKSLSLKSNDADCYLGLGNVLMELKRLDEALASYDRAIALNPKFAEARNNRGNVLKEFKRLDEALESYDWAIALNPKFAEAHNNRGNVLKEFKRLDESLASYDRAIALNPKFVEAHNNRGKVLKELKRLDEALMSFDKAIALNPKFVEAHNTRGNVLRELKRLDEALVSFDKAIALDLQFAEAHNNRGNVLNEAKRLDEALASYDRAISLNPDFSEAHSNRGTVLMDLKRLDEALASFDSAIASNLDYAEAYFNKSLCFLLRGEFSEGWKHYDWRWKLKEFTSKPLSTPKPVFNLLDRKKVLVWAEQGVADEIMFGSSLSDFRNLCAELIVQVDARLVPLFSRSISKDVILYPKKSSVPQDAYDQHISMGSIGKYVRNDEASFAAARSGYLIADSERTNEIRTFLTNNNSRKFCGISWRSKNVKTGANRSVTLTNFLELLSMDDYAFVNLQYGDTIEEIKQARMELGIDVISCDQVDNFNDLDGLASLIQACDVVASVDNTTVHLAGALGKDVRVLLPEASLDWRWQLDRKDSPWYSSATLYRQGADGDWASAFGKIRSDLQSFIA